MERGTKTGKEKEKNREPGETTRACGSMTSAKTKDEGIAWSDQIHDVKYTLKKKKKKKREIKKKQKTSGYVNSRIVQTKRIRLKVIRRFKKNEKKK